MMVPLIFRKIGWRFVVISFLISLIAFVVLLSPIILLLALHRTFVWVLFKLTRPDIDGFITKVNTQLALFSPTKSTSNIIATLVVDGLLPIDRGEKIVNERILGVKDQKGGQVYKRLLQSWENFWGYAVWKTNKNFELNNHVREYDYGGGMKLPSPCTEKDFERVLGQLLEAPWKEGQSPWEVLAVHSFVQEDSPGMKTLMIFRCDHVLADGYSLLGLLRNSFECPFVIPEPNLQPVTKWEHIRGILTMPYDTANTILLTVWKVTLPKRNRALDGVCCISPPVSVETIKLIKRHYKVSFAAVTQYIVQGSIARTLTAAGRSVPPWLSTSFVLPLPDHPEGMCIHASPLAARFTLEGTPAERLLRTQRDLVKLTRPYAAMSYVYFLSLLGYLPIAIRTLITVRGTLKGPDYVITHFPVASTREYLDGLEVLDVLPSLSSMGRIGMAIASGGVNNRQRFTFFMDPNLFGCEEAALKIGSFMQEELQTLLEDIV